MRIGIGTSTAALLLASVATLTATTHANAYREAAPPPLPPAQATTAVTLPTGDRVLMSSVDGRPDVRIVPRHESTPSAPASVISANGDTYVIPAAAGGAIGRGLSLSMFDVSALARQASTGEMTLAATFGPSYRSLPPGLTRTSATTVSVVDPTAFGDALSASLTAQQRTGRPSTLLSGLSLALPGSPATDDGVLTRPAKGRMFTVTVKGIDREGRPAAGRSACS